jgi:hypothetical protein
MTIQDLGAIGEFLGFFAVLGTLVYLSVQTRHARIASQRALTGAVGEAHARWRSALYENPELAALLARANSGESLTEGEQIQLRHLCFEIFVAGGFGYFTGKAGGPRAEVRYMVDLLNDNPSILEQWKQQRHLGIEAHPDYIELVEKQLASLSNR